MLRWERGTVKSALGSWPGVDRVEVELEDGTGTVPAIAYRELTGQPLPGELVLLNTNALRRELGTGGDAMVVARPEMLPAAEEVAGHMVKARYTPMQTIVDAIDDPAGTLRDPPRRQADRRDARGRRRPPLLPARDHRRDPRAPALGPHRVCAQRRGRAPGRILAQRGTAARGGAADQRHQRRPVLRRRSRGGHRALRPAGRQARGGRGCRDRHPGPATSAPHRLGLLRRAAAEALHAAAVLGGQGVATCVSGADERKRHRGLSHHSSTTPAGRTLPVHLPVLPRNDCDKRFHGPCANR